MDQLKQKTKKKKRKVYGKKTFSFKNDDDDDDDDRKVNTYSIKGNETLIKTVFENRFWKNRFNEKHRKCVKMTFLFFF